MESTRVLLMLLMATVAYAEVVQIGTCPDYKPDNVTVTDRNCSVHEVRVQPCSEAIAGRPCRIKRGKHASISFDYTPGVAADEVESRAYWFVSEQNQAPFKGMNVKACNYTTCPVEANTRATYTYDLDIDRKYPSREYDVLWRLWNTDGPSKLECCFIIKIKITK